MSFSFGKIRQREGCPRRGRYLEEILARLGHNGNEMEGELGSENFHVCHLEKAW